MPWSYRDFDSCIYCGGGPPPFTREHVIARGLGGGISPDGYHEALVLQNATCEDCRQITRSIEDTCLGGFTPARDRMGLTRRDRRSGVGRAEITFRDGTSATQDLPVEFLHTPMVLPQFGKAKMLLADGERFQNPTLHCLTPFTVDMSLMPNVRQIACDSAIHVPSFARMMSKIAIGLVASRFGASGVSIYVRNLMMGSDDQTFRYIGGIAIQPIPSRNLHEITIKKERIGTANFVVVYLRLFALAGGPTNYVITGHTMDPTPFEEVISYRAKRG